MGKALAEASEAARGVFARADAALGEPLSALCFEGPMEALTLTRNTQPALVTASCAALAALRERYPDLPRPAFAAGHSLGEYSALVAAGALSLEDAVRLCRLRGAAMQEAVPAGEGAMAAVMGVDAATLRELCAEAAAAAQGEVVSPANYNGPGQTVIAGHGSAVGRVGELVAQKGGKMVMLKVSAPFHCALMQPAAERLAGPLAETEMGAFAFPVVANVDGAPNVDGGRARTLLVEQVASPVQWLRTIERMAEEGVTHALEIGPGKVLAGLVKRISKQIAVHGVNDPASVERVGAFLA
ncbi:Malonyl CoA-acyl carrier protein transacylase [Chondromyces apiculatus DSM 436]|uniref:Malonyl CoA-acyl carrier protein transacylase n=2 Tax=Chondromyces apiculatus TaxID=51 RepID=A0A017T1N8_9BACT|nr:Malonyl CoA-acyl carrier protein transacylase [Chondromyces apiculatus DSM 436]